MTTRDVTARSPQDPDCQRYRRGRTADPRRHKRAVFGSDVVAEVLRDLDIPYIALNPGASYRGLHDSLVNYIGNAAPQMLLCLHEEAAVAIAHGYAKVTGKAMAAAVHSNVGLFHATMAIFNAWCDRMPVDHSRRHRAGRRRQAPAVDRLDPHRRRPGRDRAQLHQVGRPAGLPRRRARIAAARRGWIATPRRRARSTSISMRRCRRRCSRSRCRPVDANRYMPPVVNAAPADLVQARAELLKARQAPADPRRPGVARRRRRGSSASRSPRRSARACAPTCKVGAAFPTDHPLHVDAPMVVHQGRADAAPQGGRRHPQPRLGRSRRHPQAARRAAGRQGDPGLARPSAPQRLEHGLPGPAAGRSLHLGRSGYRDATRPGVSRRWARARPRPVRREPAAVQPARRGARRRRGPRPCAARRGRQARRHAHPSAALLAELVLAFPPSARLSRLRWRRRRRRRPRHFGRRGARAQGVAAGCRSGFAATAIS